MKGIAAATAGILALVIWTAGAYAKHHGFPSYWATPVPTSAAASLPNGKALIRDMYATMYRYGSVHIAFSGSWERAGVEQGTLSGTQDVSSRADRERATWKTVVTALGGGAVDYSSVQESIAIKHKQATRGEPGEIPETWMCEAVPGKLSDSYFVVYQWKHLTQVKDRGAAVVDGRPTWHVTAFDTWVERKSHRTHYEPVDYYIAQSDHTLVRELDDAAANAPHKPIPYVQTMDYSSYGEAVKVKLPKACRKH